jgi:FAD/FMN-containing dehydrogenase
VVRPGSADDVRELVTWANATLTPLVPVSSGAPHFRGDTVPATGGAVIVDLGRMNRIIRIDAEHRIAMVEPGVTFGELIPALARDGMRLNLPLLPRATKSVMGSLLEREPVIMPKYHWDIADPLACTEVIYGTGDTFRTGSAAGPGTLEEQWEMGGAQNEASGPLQADFYRLVQGAQGTMGIVTWVTTRCERLPALEEPFLVGSSSLDDLKELIHWVIRRRLVDECLVLNSVDLAQILAATQGQDAAAIQAGLPPWVLYYSIAGYNYLPEEKISYQVAEVAELAKALKLEPCRAIGQVSAFELLKALQQPSPEPYWKLRDKGSCYDIFFIAEYSGVTELVGTMKELAATCGYPAADMGVYIQPIVQGVNYHCEFNLFFDPANAAETARVRQLAEAAFEPLTNRGAFFSRPYGEFVDPTYRRDAATTIALRKIKNMYDPNNVMNPGKLCF